MPLIDYSALSPEAQYPEDVAFVFVGGPMDGDVVWGKTRGDVLGTFMRTPRGDCFYSLQGFLNHGSGSQVVTPRGTGVAHTQAVYEWGQEKCQHG